MDGTEAVYDDVPTSGSDNPVKSNGIYTALQGKQDDLTQVPTVQSLLPTDYLFLERGGAIYKILASAVVIPDGNALTTEDGNAILTENGEELLIDNDPEDAATTESGESLLTEENDVIRVDQ